MAVPNGLNHRYGATGSYPVGIEYAESERMSVFICGICELCYDNGLRRRAAYLRMPRRSIMAR